MKLKITFFLFFFCGTIIAQTDKEIKDFINKNNLAIRSVQKNMIRENLTEYTSDFKALLEKQIKTVKLYETSKSESFCLAYTVRTECLLFLKSHSVGSTIFFEITNLEKTIFENKGCDKIKAISETEKVVSDILDVMNPKSLNTISIIIQ